MQATPPAVKGTPNPNKGKKFPVRPLTAEQLAALLHAPSRRAPTGVRNSALVAMMGLGGLRVSEALALKPGDLDLDEGSIRVDHGKGDHQRVAGLLREATPFVQRWLDVRKGLGVMRDQAEALKCRFGLALADLVEEPPT